MDLMALMEILRQKYGEEVQLTPGCEYSVELTSEELLNIFGEVPATPIAYGVNLRQTPDSKFEVLVERHQIN